MSKTKEKTISIVSQEMLDNFKQSERKEGTKYWHRINHNIEWQKDICFQAHQERLPNDWIYEQIVNTLELLSECESEDEAQERIYEIEADYYTANLTSWIADNVHNVYYLTQALEEFESKDGFQALSMAQYLHKKDIAQSVLSGILNRLENLE